MFKMRILLDQTGRLAGEYSLFSKVYTTYNNPEAVCIGVNTENCIVIIVLQHLTEAGIVIFQTFQFTKFTKLFRHFKGTNIQLFPTM